MYPGALWSPGETQTSQQSGQKASVIHFSIPLTYFPPTQPDLETLSIHSDVSTSSKSEVQALLKNPYKPTHLFLLHVS